MAFVPGILDPFTFLYDNFKGEGWCSVYTNDFCLRSRGFIHRARIAIVACMCAATSFFFALSYLRSSLQTHIEQALVRIAGVKVATELV